MFYFKAIFIQIIVFTTHAQQVGVLQDGTSDETNIIIVGGGIAGLTLANRLTEDPKINVHLLEAGPDPTNDPMVSTPGFAGLLAPSKYSWNYTTTPQSALANNVIHTYGGHAYGGGSSINYMSYGRGAASVFDEWATITGDPGWEWHNFLKYFQKSTTFIPAIQNHVPVIDFNLYGNGPVSISSDNEVDVQASAWLEAFQDEGLPNIDPNGGNGIFGTYSTKFILPTNATRVSALTAYGYPAEGRPNLRCTSNTRVILVSFNGSRATTVRYTSTIDGSVHELSGDEIILSAGSIQSAKLLMVSGIGPANDLERLGIPVIADLPVGIEMQNHMGAIVAINVTQQEWSASLLTNSSVAAAAQAAFIQNHSGILTNSGSTVVGAGRVPDDVLRAANATWHLSVPPDRPHFLYNPALAPLLPGDYEAATNVVSAVVFLVSPESRGTVKLRSANYADDAAIDFNTFGTSGDRAVMSWAYKNMRRLVRSDPLRKSGVSNELFPGPDIGNSEEEIWNAISQSAFDFRHTTGTVQLGKVLNNDFTVKGVQSLRVIDISTMPQIPSTYTAASVYASLQNVQQI